MTGHVAFRTADFFDADMAAAYDRRNSGLQPISDGLHFLMRLVLTELPQDARILCVGVGTGADIFALAEAFPGWTFTGVDPSPDMLAIAAHRLADAGLADRCTLVAGHVEDLTETGFDAAVSLLVAHFVQEDARPAFYRAIHDRLRPGGRFVSAEISADLDGAGFPAMLADWRQVQVMMGANEASLAALPDMLRDVLCVLPEDRTAQLWQDAGLSRPVPFFQSFMIRAWHGTKPAAAG
ncbi:class I SAM-dependent methyltransferase [Qipengyuania sp. JC766]|uniref:SAM-dependent methyltransferase n=1 Tax=Qipengyuania sp. JC766 TaxID=3232139 RepID=UPI00345999A9